MLKLLIEFRIVCPLFVHIYFGYLMCQQLRMRSNRFNIDSEHLLQVKADQTAARLVNSYISVNSQQEREFLSCPPPAFIRVKADSVKLHRLHVP